MCSLGCGQEAGHLVGYFNEHGIADAYGGYIAKVIQLLGSDFHSYIGNANRDLPPEAGVHALLWRLALALQLPVAFPK